MNRPTKRYPSLCWLALGLWSAASGCQSVTQQKAAWSFPPIGEQTDDRPIITVENQALPPLPIDYDRLVNIRPAPPAAVVANQAQPKTDTDLVRTGSFTPTVHESKASSGVQTAAVSIAPVGGFEASSLSDKPLPVPPPQEPPHSGLVALDARSTQKVVKEIVGATDAVLRTGFDQVEEEDLPMRPVIDIGSSALPLPSNSHREVSRSVARSVSDVSLPGVGSGGNQPPLEPLSPEPPVDAAVKSSELSIPKAAVCRAVRGRGRFEALPAHMWRPGSTILVYWEMDGLSRESARKSASFSAVVELVSSDRELILASVRESAEFEGEATDDGDYAALRWTVPAEVPMGEYKLRITVTDNATRTATSTTLDLPLGRGLVASSFSFP